MRLGKEAEEAILMEHGKEEVAKRKLTPAERERYLQIKRRMLELYEEDGKLRAELERMGLKFERKWWHGPLGKPANFEI